MKVKRTRDAQPVPEVESGGSAYAQITPLGVPTDEQLRIINDNHARKPLTADQVYVFEMEISNDLMDSYFTRMDPETTLKNYVDDFKEGRSLQNSHEAHELGIGRSFDARLEERGDEGNDRDPKRTSVVVSDYIQRGIQLARVHNDHVIAGIDGGTIKDGSIRFTGAGEYRCSVCSGDMADMFGECTHVPGVQYKDDSGKRSMAFANIVNDHASEHSLVFDGSTPRAMIDKAQRMVATGKLSEPQIRQFEANANCRVKRVGRQPTRGKRAMAMSFEDTKDALQSAISGKYDDDCYVYLVVTTETDVTYEVNGGDMEGTYQVPYTITADGVVTLGEPVEAVVTTTVKTKPAAGTGRASTNNGGSSMDPKAIAALVGLPESQRSSLFSLVVEQLGEGLTPELVRSVAAQVKERGLQIADTVIDGHLATMDAAKGDDVARDALQALVSIEEVVPAAEPSPTRGADDVEKTLTGLRLLVASLEETVEGETPEEAETRAVRRSNVQRALKKPEFTDVDNLLRSAEAGRRYRSALVRDVHAWGVRAQGTSYDRGLIDTLTERANPEQLEILGKQLREQAAARYAHVKPEDIPEELRDAMGAMLGSTGRQTVSSDPSANLNPQGGKITERFDAAQFKTPAPGR